MRVTDIRSALEAASSEAFLACDTAGIVRWCDDRAKDWLGDVVGRPVGDLGIHGAEDALAKAPAQGVGGETKGVFVGRTLREGDAIGFILRRGDTATVAGAVAQLAESRRGLLLLHEELDKRSEEQATAAQVKHRVFQSLGHEVRTPLHSILGLSQLLLDGADGPLTPEQRVQVNFIRGAAEELSSIVQETVDLATYEKGRATLGTSRFSVSDLLESVRGTITPLVPIDGHVTLDVLAPSEDFELDTDRARVAQVLRNLITNAIKYTERGSVRVGVLRVQGTEHADAVDFVVRDTGPGISPTDLEKIFDEFFRADSVSHIRGSGLGLAISLSQAKILGGEILVDSEVGVGSTFRLRVPRVHPEVEAYADLEQRSKARDHSRPGILVVEDDRKAMFLYDKFLGARGFDVLPARSTEEGRRLLETERPMAIVLDVMLEGETSWQFLEWMKAQPELRDIPTLVVSVVGREARAASSGADEFWRKPINYDRLLGRLETVASTGVLAKVLIVEDDEATRYVLRKHFVGTPYQLVEASTGREAIELAQREVPSVILLDFHLGDATALDVIEALRADPRTRDIPRVIISGIRFDDEARRKLDERANRVLSKLGLSKELALRSIREALASAGIGPALPVRPRIATEDDD